MFTADPQRMIVAGIIDNMARLAAVTTITTLASLLPEREPHPRIYDASLLLLDHLDDDAIWPALLVRWELGLLDELGFGLDLEKCAMSGVRHELAFVSPRTGKAVTAQAGEQWKDKLLRLPGFIAGAGGAPDRDDVADGLELTGHFLARHVFEPRGVAAPEQRNRIVRWLRTG